MEERAARSWALRAIDGIREIEDAGSLAPGLSHQEFYIEELKATIRRLLKTRWEFVKSDPELFAGISAGLRGDVMMEDFVSHLKSVPGLEDQGREEIIAELKTAVEPFRSLYYVKINYVRYLKGLRNFQKSL